MFNVVLVAPEIPPNTGNVIRLCSNAGCALHLIRPLGFDLDHAKLRRAGLDYREFVDVRIYDTFEAFAAQSGITRMFMFSKFHSRTYDQARFCQHDALVFGSETSGLPESVRTCVAPEFRLTLPMALGSRSLNLSNAVAVAVYEAWRQNNFAHARDISPETAIG